MGSHEDNLAKLCAVLQRNVTGSDITVGPATLLASDLGIDSAQLMEVLLEVEDEFDVSIPLNVLPSISTVDELGLELDKLVAAQ